MSRLASAPLAPGLTRRQVLALAGLCLASPAGAQLVETVRRLRPACVAVGSFAETDAPRFGFRGTGFVVGDGLTVVTCWHVLPPPERTAPATQRQLSVMVPDPSGREGQIRVATLAASDPEHDLAVLRLEGPPLPAMTLADATLQPEGTEIGLIGFPMGGVFGFRPVVHRGIVAAIVRIAQAAPSAQRLTPGAVVRLRSGPFTLYQLDATAYPGNSGGPVFDTTSGEVLGVVNMVVTRGTRESALTQPTGISYAIPMAPLLPLLPAR